MNVYPVLFEKTPLPYPRGKAATLFFSDRSSRKRWSKIDHYGLISVTQAFLPDRMVEGEKWGEDEYKIMNLFFPGQRKPRRLLLCLQDGQGNLRAKEIKWLCR
jgi:hypothetical protein